VEAKNDRHNQNPETLQDLQVCLYDWQRYNFGVQDPDLALLGIFEECGELCHSQLKREQGIRGTKEEHDLDMIDAIGDVTIYTMNYLSGIDKKFPNFSQRTEVSKAEEDETGQILVRKAVKACFRLAGKIREDSKDNNDVRQLVHQLSYLCALKGWDLEDILRTTWGVVQKRDWRRWPQTGKPDGASAVPAGTTLASGASPAMQPNVVSG